MAKKKKNKIRVIDPDQDLNILFNEKPISNSSKATKSHSEADTANEIPETEFSKLLDLSLKGKNTDKMLQEKSDRGAPKKVSLSKRLKRFPPCESTLDLHGYTADGAVIKGKSYIKQCFKNGIFTLRIVVGKGTHSDFGAVLPGVIEDLLVKLKDQGIVLHFKFEKKKKTKSGAIIVYLNQFND